MNVNANAVEVAPANLVVRCYAERVGDQWQAFSLEYGLAAQADTLQEVKGKLDAMIEDYVVEALTVDREHAADLLSRKATLPVRARFVYYRFRDVLTNGHTVFKEAVALPIRACPA